MGYPIRANVFRPGSEREFSTFAVQVLLLFRPDDRRFVDHLSSNFLHLHRKTGRGVVFFAPLDPPESWLSDSANRRWWHAYQQQFGGLHVSFDDVVLVNELCRLFGVELAELPLLIASPSFWQDDLIAVPTSEEVLGLQLAALTRLARRVDAPSIDEMDRELLAAGGGVMHPLRIAAVRKEQLGDFYEALEFLHPDRRSWLGEVGLDAAALRVLGGVNRSLAAWRSDRARPDLSDVNEEVERYWDARLDDATGRLIPLATVAERISRGFPTGNWLPALDKESSLMLDTAHRVGWFLEQLATLGVQVDFTAGAQGAWKAFEREVNLSAVQAARGSLGIEMPQYFGLYKKSFPCKVQTGPTNRADLNEKGKLIAGQRRHKFVTLGTAFFAIENLLEDPEGKLNFFLKTELGFPPFNQTVRQAWERIYKIRNEASHVEPLDRSRYDEIFGLVGQPTVIEPLLELKTKLRNRPMHNN